MRKSAAFSFIVGMFAITVAGCASESSQSNNAGTLQVTAGFYPLAYAAQQVGGDLVSVTDLTPPGGEPHDLELSPRQVSDLSSQDLVIYLGNRFQPAVEEAIQIQDIPSLDAMSAVDPEKQREGDSHIWLNPLIMGQIGQGIADQLSQIDPENASSYQAGAAKFEEQMQATDASYKNKLSTCNGATLVTSHEAFGYMADEYGLEQVGISGIEPDAEPSPKRLREVEDIVKERGVTTIFFESSVAEATADRLAETLGVKTEELNTLETEPSTDFAKVMESNLLALENGLNCE
jgi:ABC-type metal ion transport system, periplasmic component/surface adhesin